MKIRENISHSKISANSETTCAKNRENGPHWSSYTNHDSNGDDLSSCSLPVQSFFDVEGLQTVIKLTDGKRKIMSHNGFLPNSKFSDKEKGFAFENGFETPSTLIAMNKAEDYDKTCGSYDKRKNGSSDKSFGSKDKRKDGSNDMKYHVLEMEHKLSEAKNLVSALLSCLKDCQCSTAKNNVLIAQLTKEKNRIFSENKGTELKDNIGDKFTESKHNLKHKFTESKHNLKDKFTESKHNLIDKFTESKYYVEDKCSESNHNLAIEENIDSLEKKMCGKAYSSMNRKNKLKLPLLNGFSALDRPSSLSKSSPTPANRTKTNPGKNKSVKNNGQPVNCFENTLKTCSFSIKNSINCSQNEKTNETKFPKTFKRCGETLHENDQKDEFLTFLKSSGARPKTIGRKVENDEEAKFRARSILASTLPASPTGKSPNSFVEHSFPGSITPIAFTALASPRKIENSKSDMKFNAIQHDNHSIIENPSIVHDKFLLRKAMKVTNNVMKPVRSEPCLNQVVPLSIHKKSHSNEALNMQQDKKSSGIICNDSLCLVKNKGLEKHEHKDVNSWSQYKIPHQQNFLRQKSASSLDISSTSLTIPPMHSSVKYLNRYSFTHPDQRAYDAIIPKSNSITCQLKTAEFKNHRITSEKNAGRPLAIKAESIEKKCSQVSDIKSANDHVVNCAWVQLKENPKNNVNISTGVPCRTARAVPSCTLNGNRRNSLNNPCNRLVPQDNSYDKMVSCNPRLSQPSLSSVHNISSDANEDSYFRKFRRSKHEYLTNASSNFSSHSELSPEISLISNTNILRKTDRQRRTQASRYISSAILSYECGIEDIKISPQQRCYRTHSFYHSFPSTSTLQTNNDFYIACPYCQKIFLENNYIYSQHLELCSGPQYFDM